MTNSVGCPDAVRQAALEGMSRRASTRGFLTPKLRKADPKCLRLCLPHRMAFLPISELRADANLRTTARIFGWRLFISESTNVTEPIAAAHVVLTETGEYRLSELNEGQFVSSPIMKALQIAASEKSVLEKLLLLAPAVYFVGLWARFGNEDQDRVLPIEPTIHGLPIDPLTPAQLLRALCDEANRAAGNHVSQTTRN
jgi:hypothetical protein